MVSHNTKELIDGQRDFDTPAEHNMTNNVRGWINQFINNLGDENAKHLLGLESFPSSTFEVFSVGHSIS